MYTPMALLMAALYAWAAVTASTLTFPDSGSTFSSAQVWSYPEIDLVVEESE